MREQIGRLLRQEEVSDLLGEAPRTLQEWRCRGVGPPWVRLPSRAIRYPEARLLEWVGANIRTSIDRSPRQGCAEAEQGAAVR
jgi:predicted DNA-binding transcriptional regulator AlpA